MGKSKEIHVAAQEEFNIIAEAVANVPDSVDNLRAMAELDEELSPDVEELAGILSTFLDDATRLLKSIAESANFVDRSGTVN